MSYGASAVRPITKNQFYKAEESISSKLSKKKQNDKIIGPL